MKELLHMPTLLLTQLPMLLLTLLLLLIQLLMLLPAQLFMLLLTQLLLPTQLLMLLLTLLFLAMVLLLDMELPTLVRIPTDFSEILFILGHIYSYEDQRLKYRKSNSTLSIRT